ncbi:hypothetical protein [Aeromonas salmonicida]|uniref:hypothetical protein n=1 Tax=Aeromonas salmonicida TaxID=645 RepID=UPI00240DE62D|nr:hypothetical protein [Aeromonas salmonicida]WFC12249.1 hypothetical protein L3V47_10770 [Aeromonas salmonicida]
MINPQGLSMGWLSGIHCFICQELRINPLLQKACEVLAGAGGLILSSGGRDKVRLAVLLRQT